MIYFAVAFFLYVRTRVHSCNVGCIRRVGLKFMGECVSASCSSEDALRMHALESAETSRDAFVLKIIPSEKCVPTRVYQFSRSCTRSSHM